MECFFNDSDNGLSIPPGTVSTISLGGGICEEVIAFEMPLRPVGEDPKWGNSCRELIITPLNPFSVEIEIDINNPGNPEDVSVFHIDTNTGQRERILSPTRLNSGEELHVVYNTSHWQNGPHLLHVYYGEQIIAGQVIKQE